jgi:hypothetical protein
MTKLLKTKGLYLIGVMFLCCGFNSYAQCNGHPSLCDKKYNEVAYLTTHNAYSSAEDGFSLPNHNYNIATQLNDGVRAFMIDVYDLLGTTTVYHGSAVLGSEPLQTYLDDIKSFMDNNPNEIITLILECYVTANDIQDELQQSGLGNYIYTHNTNEWPTLQTMIDNDTRFVLFSDEDDANSSQGWYHYMWNYMVETHYSASDTSDFSCDFNRGDAANDLFIFNHFLTHSVTGTGVESKSMICNSNPYFINRVRSCEQEKNKFPNFLTVDFYELGNCFDVVDELNGVMSSTQQTTKPKLRIYPNPFKNRISITIPNADNSYQLNIINLKGQQVLKRKGRGSIINIPRGKLAKGQYIINIQTPEYNFKERVSIQ